MSGQASPFFKDTLASMKALFQNQSLSPKEKVMNFAQLLLADMQEADNFETHAATAEEINLLRCYQMGAFFILLQQAPFYTIWNLDDVISKFFSPWEALQISNPGLSGIPGGAKLASQLREFALNLSVYSAHNLKAMPEIDIPIYSEDKRNPAYTPRLESHLIQKLDTLSLRHCDHLASQCSVSSLSIRKKEIADYVGQLEKLLGQCPPIHFHYSSAEVYFRAKVLGRIFSALHDIDDFFGAAYYAQCTLHHIKALQTAGSPYVAQLKKIHSALETFQQYHPDEMAYGESLYPIMRTLDRLMTSPDISQARALPEALQLETRVIRADLHPRAQADLRPLLSAKIAEILVRLSPSERNHIKSSRARLEGFLDCRADLPLFMEHLITRITPLAEQAMRDQELHPVAAAASSMPFAEAHGEKSLSTHLEELHS